MGIAILIWTNFMFIIHLLYTESHYDYTWTGLPYKCSIVQFEYCPVKIIKTIVSAIDSAPGEEGMLNTNHCPNVFWGVMLSLFEERLMYLAIGQINTQNSQRLRGNKRMKEFIVIHLLNPHCAILIHIQNISSSRRQGCEMAARNIFISTVCNGPNKREKNEEWL